MASFSSLARLKRESLMCFTALALSYHSFVFCGFAFICCSKSSYMASFSFVAFCVVRLRLSSTMEKPLSTSFETFSASMAIKTTYIRFIIFWRGDTGLFLIAIAIHFSPFTNQPSPLMSEAPFGMFTVMASIMRA